MAVVVNAAVEDIVDEAVAVRLISHVGGKPGEVYGKQGKGYLQRTVKAYNQAANYAPWLVLVDLDHDANCAPLLRRSWVPTPAPRLCFRVAVRAVESWLLADAEAMAGFLGVARSKIPPQPEALPDPKRTLVDLARASRRREIRLDMVPREGSGRSEGPAYTSRLIEYVGHHWRPEEAAKRAESLARTIRCLRRLMEQAGDDPQGLLGGSRK